LGQEEMIRHGRTGRREEDYGKKFPWRLLAKSKIFHCSRFMSLHDVRVCHKINITELSIVAAETTTPATTVTTTLGQFIEYWCKLTAF